MLDGPHAPKLTSSFPPSDNFTPFGTTELGIGIGIFNDNEENNQDKTMTEYEIKAHKQLES